MNAKEARAKTNSVMNHIELSEYNMIQAIIKKTANNGEYTFIHNKKLTFKTMANLKAEKFELQDDEIINQTELKQVGLAVFDRTFAVTRALNALTLLVAAIGIFCAISAIHHHRVGQQALLASLGLSRRERGALLLLQWGMLGLLCMVLVWPLGTLLAAYLGMVVTPVAFGWSFPLQLD